MASVVKTGHSDAKYSEMIKTGKRWTRKPRYAGAIYILLTGDKHPSDKPAPSWHAYPGHCRDWLCSYTHRYRRVHHGPRLVSCCICFFIQEKSCQVSVDPGSHHSVLSFAGHLSAALAALFLVLAIQRRKGPADLLAAGGLTILLFCELFYLADNMGEIYYRMNTVFKLYIGAWMLCGTAAALMAGDELDAYIARCQGIKVQVIRCTFILLLSLCLIVPPVAVSTMHGPHTPTLDGMAWLMNSHKEDAEAIAFLRTLPGEHVIVEAAGDDYQYTSRVSSFTGIPTIVGWQFHEYMWRGNTPEGWYGVRGNDIRTIYENPDLTIR